MERFAGDFLRTGDRDLAKTLVHPDVLLHLGGQEFRGIDLYLETTASIHAAFSEMMWTVQEMVVDHKWVAIRFVIRGIHSGVFEGVAPTGLSVTAQSMSIYRLADGLIVDEIAQPDILSIHRQIGSLPPGL